MNGMESDFCEGEACEAGVQRAYGPLAEVFRGRSPLNGGGEMHSELSMRANCLISRSDLLIFVHFTLRPLFITHFVTLVWFERGFPTLGTNDCRNGLDKPEPQALHVS